MEKIPVIVLKNKSKIDRYLASSIDVGDWKDEDLDVTLEDIESAFIVWRKDFKKPNDEDVNNLKAESKAYKEMMFKKFGEDAIITYDMEKWLEYYEPINIEITKDQFEKARDLAFM